MRKKNNEITYFHVSSSSAHAGFREATGIRRAPKRRTSGVFNQVLAWSRLGRKRSFTSFIRGVPEADIEKLQKDTVFCKVFGPNVVKTHTLYPTSSCSILGPES